jgi:hypothetical protein
MRGYQKRVIYLKNTGSSLFEGAYFVVKSDKDLTYREKEKMVDEANRIIKENFKREKKQETPIFSYVLAFLVGIAISSLAYTLVF